MLAPLAGTLGPLSVPGPAVAAPSGRSALFDGSTQSLSMASVPAITYSGGDLTVSGWFRAVGSNSITCLAVKGWSGSPEWQIMTNAAGQLTAQIWKVGGGPAGTPAGATLTLNTWWFVMMEWVDSTKTLTVTRDLDFPTSVVVAEGLNAAGADAFEVSSAANGFNRFSGRVDALFIQKRALTAAEKAWLFNGGSGRRFAETGQAGTDGADLRTSLAEWWDLDELSDGSAAVPRVGAFAGLTLTDTGKTPSAAGVPN
jgi:hypothetical protein